MKEKVEGITSSPPVTEETKPAAEETKPVAEHAAEKV
jgi:hypothetical protein